MHGTDATRCSCAAPDLDESLDVGSTKYFRIGVHGWSAHGSTFKLAVTEVPNDERSPPARAMALDSIFDKCCDATRSCTFWKAHRDLSIDPCHSRFARCDARNETTMLDLSAENMACELDASGVSARWTIASTIVAQFERRFVHAREQRHVDRYIKCAADVGVARRLVRRFRRCRRERVARATNLISIKAISSNVTGNFPSCLLNKQNLQVVRMAGNYMTGTLPALTSTTLRTLDVRLQKSAESIAGRFLRRASRRLQSWNT